MVTKYLWSDLLQRFLVQQLTVKRDQSSDQKKQRKEGGYKELQNLSKYGDLIEMKKIRARTQRFLKNKKRNGFINFGNSLHRESNIKDTWNNGILMVFTSFVPFDDHLRRNMLQSMAVADWDPDFQKEQSTHRTEEFSMAELHTNFWMYSTSAYLEAHYLRDGNTIWLCPYVNQTKNRTDLKTLDRSSCRHVTLKH